MRGRSRAGRPWVGAGGRGVLASALLVAASWACSSEARAPGAGSPSADRAVPGPAAAPALAADSAAHPFTEPVIVFATAGAEELDAARAEMGDEDFYAMADDLMWYRAMAEDVLAGQDVPVERIEGRAGLRFLVDGAARPHGFPEIPTLDLIVLYRPGAEPAAVPPIELSVDPDLIARYFADSVAGHARPGG